jgi:aconitase B
MSTPTRKRSLSGPSSSVKKKKYNCKFQADWMKDFQFLRPSSLGNESSFCTLCSVNFSVASGGLYDVKRHAKCETHNKAVEAQKTTKSMANDTICSLICAKQNQNMECYEYCPDSEVLKKAKTVCIDYNNVLKK